MANPPLPTAKVNKTGTHSIEVRVFKQLEDRFKRVLADLRKYVEEIPVTITTNQKIYLFDLDQDLIEEVGLTVDEIIDEILLEGGDSADWLVDAAGQAYENSTEQAIESMDIITDGEYPRTYNKVRLAPAFRDRLAYLGTRAFEDFKGFAEEQKSQLRRILLDGMARGQNPNRIAADINRNLFGGEKKKGVRKTKGNIVRAKRIARTEITYAHRRAIWDEDKAANDTGFHTKLMHISALIPERTRRTHALRHGKLYTRQEVEEWYSINGNAINCLCTQITVIVDSKGEVINAAFVKKVVKQRQKFLGTHSANCLAA